MLVNEKKNFEVLHNKRPFRDSAMSAIKCIEERFFTKMIREVSEGKGSFVSLEKTLTVETRALKETRVFDEIKVRLSPLNLKSCAILASVF